MRKILLPLLVLISFVSYGQKKAQREIQKSIVASIDRLVYLHDQHYRANKIYTYSISWASIAEFVEDREVLQKTMIDKLSAPEAVVLPAAYDSINRGIALLESLAQKNMLLLAEFSDYYMPELPDDSTVRPSPQATEARQRVDVALTQQFERVSGIMKRQLVAEKQALDALLAKNILPAESAGTLTENLHASEKLTEAREYSLRVYGGSISWLFRRHDTVAKARLLKDIESPVRLVDNIDIKAAAMRSDRARIEELMIDNSIQSHNSIATIETDEQYDDPITVLLAEDAIQSAMSVNMIEIDRLSKALLRDAIEEIKLSMADDQEQKNADIRRMLRDSKTIDLYILLMEKQIPDFNKDAFIEMVVPTYAKRFSHDEIRQIIKFQKTSAGKKLNQYSADIAVEIMKSVIEKINIIDSLQKP
jgi:hypothetical protein